MAKEGSKKKIGSIIADVLVALVVVFAAVITIMVLTSTQNESRTPNLFGYAIMSVQSESMDVDGGFAKGDMIIVKLLDEEEANNLEIGEVISYTKLVDNQLIVNTHRIVEKDNYGGVMYYKTQGDNELFKDLEDASKNNILGKWTGVKFSGLGKIFDFLRSQFGFFLCVLLPIALFFLWQLYKLIAAINDNKKAKALAEISENEEEIKKKAIEEYLAKQKENSEDTSQSESNQE